MHWVYQTWGLMWSRSWLDLHTQQSGDLLGALNFLIFPDLNGAYKPIHAHSHTYRHLHMWPCITNARTHTHSQTHAHGFLVHRHAFYTHTHRRFYSFTHMIYTLTYTHATFYTHSRKRLQKGRYECLLKVTGHMALLASEKYVFPCFGKLPNWEEH